MPALGPSFSALPPLSLYIHIPWCVRKCPYCDFNSHERGGGLPEREYVAALLADLESELPLVWGRTVQTVFIGGGTPSLFSPEAIDALLAGVRARLRLAPEAEVTMEANPGTFERARFVGYRAAGVTRLSIGVQSFDSDKLATLGRIHSGDEASAAIEAALGLFPSVNVDLMYALPGQTVAQALADIETALALGVPHLSCYQLTLEPNTVFAKKPPPGLPEHDAAAEMQQAIEERLAATGFEHYETSAFARPGHRCRHNLNYWTFGDYLGIGAGAHGKLTLPDPPRIERTERVKQPREYLGRAAKGEAVFERRTVARSEVGFEFMLNALRLTEGFPVALFAERTGWPISIVDRALARIEAEGLIERDHRLIRPTERGRRFLNRALEAFL
ncbi:MAG: radical SAM family heme chaperone HemW [Casimicrobiaceae bacterium]